MTDIVIIGSGPAGLTAAVYARRSNKTVLVLEKESFGGQITHSPKVGNYPGFNMISGSELADNMLEQALALGAEVELDEATGITKTESGITVSGTRADYECSAVIIAAGSKHRSLGIPNEEELVGNGVSYCAVCDGAFYANKSVAVIGGGNSALQDAILLSERCSSVTVVQNLSFLTGEDYLQKQLAERKNVKIILGSVADAFIGSGELEALVIREEATGKKQTLEVDGVFIAIGQMPENEAFTPLVKLDRDGYIEAGEDCLTGADGVFTAGDCRRKRIRQVTTAVADGASAAIAACRYIDSL